jgi:hypothetical protein
MSRLSRERGGRPLPTVSAHPGVWCTDRNPWLGMAGAEVLRHATHTSRSNSGIATCWAGDVVWAPLLTGAPWAAGVFLMLFLAHRVYAYIVLKLILTTSPDSCVHISMIKTMVTPKTCSCQQPTTTRSRRRKSNVTKIRNQRKDPPELPRAGTG